MEYFTVLVFGLVFLAATTAALDAEQMGKMFEEIKDAHQYCNEDFSTQVDLEQIRNMRHGGQRPENLGRHIMCILKYFNIQNDDGCINEEVLRAKGKEVFGDGPKLEEVLKECLQKQENDEATAEYLFECYMKHIQMQFSRH